MATTLSIKIKTIADVNGTKVVANDLKGLEDLLGRVTAAGQRTTGALDGMAAMAVKFAAINQSIQQVNAQIEQMAQSYKSFETAMRAVNTMAGENAEGLAALEAQVKGLSREVPVLRDELAAGLYQVISNGVPKDNWLEFLEQSARASVGGIADLGQVVGVTATIIKNYGLAWDSAADVQDKIQLAARNGVTSFEQMAGALPRVAANAATLGVSIDELMATFATLTGVSGNTAEVSTQLAAVFTALIKPSHQAAQQAEQMGIRFDAAAIKAAGGMQNFLTQLDADVKSYAAANGVLVEEVYAKLFGSAEALRAITPITGELADTFAANVATMQNSAGTIEAAFEDMGQTAEAKSVTVRNMMASITDCAGAVAAAAQPYVAYAAQIGMAIQGLNAMSKALNLNKLATTYNAHATKMAQAAMMAFGVTTRGGTAALTAFRVAVYAAEAALTAGLAIVLALVVEGLTQLYMWLTDTTEEFEKFDEAADEAARSQQRVAAATDNAMAECQAAAAQLKALMNANRDTTAAVDELNRKYGDTFGTFKTAADWYEVLTKKAKVYAQVVGNTELLKQQSTQLAMATNARENFEAKHPGAAADSTEITGKESDLTKTVGRANAELYGMLCKTEADLQKQVQATADKIAGYSAQLEAAMPSKTATAGAAIPEAAATKGGAVAVAIEAPATADLNLSTKALDATIKAAADSLAAFFKTDYAGQDASIDQINAGIAKYNEAYDNAHTPEGRQAAADEVARRQRMGDARQKEKTQRGDLAFGMSLGTADISGMDITGLESIRQRIANAMDMSGLSEEQIRHLQSIGEAAKQEQAKIERSQVSLMDYANAASNCFGNAGRMLGSLSSMTDDASGAWLNYAGNVLTAVGAAIPAIASVIAAQSAQATSGAIAGSMTLPYPFNLIAMGISIAAVVAALAQIPKFAEGGIAYGPTLGVFGEYAGASNNPEVVAPLNKLRDLIGTDEGGGPGGVVRVEIEGHKLIGFINKEQRHYGRM